MIRIRPATTDDIPALYALDDRTRTDPARKPFIERSVNNEETYVAEYNAAIVGYGVLNYTFYDNGFVAMLMVRDDNRRQGIGSQLMHHMESICTTSKLFTSTNESNTPMQALLAKLDYQPSGRIDNLDEGDPELVYSKFVKAI